MNTSASLYTQASHSVLLTFNACHLGQVTLINVRLHLSVPHRFDESGKGKGLDGRVDKVDGSGYVGNYKGEGTYDKKH